MTYTKTTFQINKMDCPSEEQLIRMALSEFTGIANISVDIEKRQVQVSHQENPDSLLKTIDKLNLESQIISNEPIQSPINPEANQIVQSFILGQVFLINLSFFIIEELAAYYFKSLGLSADGLDMLADSLVYLLALMVVGRTVSSKKFVSAIAGYLQLILAMVGFGQVIFRVINHQYLPNGIGMMTVAFMALAANIVSLYLISKADQKEVHMKATKLFTSNDILINLGLIASSLLVSLCKSAIPDLVIGSLIFILVFKGSLKIIALSK